MPPTDGMPSWTATRVVDLLHAIARLHVRFVDARGRELAGSANLESAGHDEDFLLERTRGQMPIRRHTTLGALRHVLAWWIGCDLVIRDPRWGTDANETIPCLELLDDPAIERLNRLFTLRRSDVQGWLSRQGAHPDPTGILHRASPARAVNRNPAPRGSIGDPYEGREPYLFVSYRHPDRETIAGILSELQRRGVRLWWDRSLHVGAAYADVIESQLRSCSGLLLCITENTIRPQAEDWVYQETRTALEAGREVLPLRQEGLELPLRWRVLLGHRHAIDLHDWNDPEAIERILVRARALGCVRE